MPATPTVELNNGVAMPRLGFGVFQVPEDETMAAVGAALDAGYRSIDTAAAYGNEAAVGKAVDAAGIDRDELFITTKLANDAHGRDNTLRAFDESMAKLGLEQLDLYLIHWPLPGQDRYVETWQTFEQIYADGRVRAIGVSNFQRSHLNRLAAEATVVPALNQVELHPFFPQDELRALHSERGIATEAWSPLGRGGELLTAPAVTRIAEQHAVSAAQVVLRWHLQLGNVVIPKSVTPERIRSNIDVLGFELSSGEMAEVSGLDRGTRLGPDPDTFGR